VSPERLALIGPVKVVLGLRADNGFRGSAKLKFFLMISASMNCAYLAEDALFLDLEADLADRLA
jgi:hypothetical protein